MGGTWGLIRQRSKRWLSALAAVVLAGGLWSPSAASADSLVVTNTPGTLSTTDAITGITTDGADMTGVSVTAFFNNGSSESLSWAATGPVSGGVTGTGWSLTETGDTFGGDWTLTNATALPITRLLVDGDAGQVVFDIVSGLTGTPNSADGSPFALVGTSGAGRDLLVNYTNIVGVGGNPPVGDLYRTMDITFNLPGGAMIAGSPSLVFETDVDSTTTDIIVPEPASAAVLAVLGLAMGTMRPRRQVKN